MISLFPSRTVFLSIGDFSIHWYGIMYLCAFTIAFFVVQRLQRYRNIDLSSDDWASILSAVIIGVLAGGRLGYVLFYEPAYFLQNPLEIFAVWRGGMSSHGGFIGVALAGFFAVRKYNISFWDLADILAVPIAIGLACGRLGNFINLELYGVQTTLPWGISIPGLVGQYHPTQLYAVAKDLFIAGVCLWHLRKMHEHAGLTFGLFLVLYGALRFSLEYIRVQQYPDFDLGLLSLTRGQLLTLPIFLIGIIMLMRRKNAR